LGWYATFDGYPVVQAAPNHWVYGRVEHPGSIVPTNVAVGAVVPMDVPELARAAVSLNHGGAYMTKEFQRVAHSRLDNMGVLNDPLAYTPVAWKSGETELRVWLGNRWFRIVPFAGQTTSQALRARHPYIVRALREKKASWTRSDTQDLADLAREWGCLWRGAIPYASFTGRRDDNTSDGSSQGTLHSSAESDGGGGNWDIGGDSGSSGSGGGWDTGGTPSAGSGGWDADGGSNGDSGGSSPGGGWDK
jgi:hypothetical protein